MTSALLLAPLLSAKAVLFARWPGATSASEQGQKTALKCSLLFMNTRILIPPSAGCKTALHRSDHRERSTERLPPQTREGERSGWQLLAVQLEALEGQRDRIGIRPSSGLSRDLGLRVLTVLTSSRAASCTQPLLSLVLGLLLSLVLGMCRFPRVRAGVLPCWARGGYASNFPRQVPHAATGRAEEDGAERPSARHTRLWFTVFIRRRDTVTRHLRAAFV